MSNSVVLAQPSEQPLPEGIVTGRLSSSKYNDVALVQPVEFRKDGGAATGQIGGRWYNTGNTPLKVQDVHVSVGTAPTGSGLSVDVKKNGTSVFAAAGDRATVPASGNASPKTEPTKTGDAVIVRPGEYVTVEVAGVGSTVAGSDVLVKVRFI